MGNVPRRLLAALMMVACAGCFLRNIEELPLPESHRDPAPEWRSNFDRSIDKPLMASLGDTLFVVERYFLRQQIFAIDPPLGMAPLPPAQSWSITHTWGEYVVYTSPDYYKGSVGVPATRDGRLPKPPMLLQVSGLKWGKTWAVKARAGDALFVRLRDQVEVWGVRYGGRRGESTEFQIIDRKNPNVTQVVQNLSVTDRDLLAGVLIKGVLVRVVEPEQHGAITYSLADVEQVRRASQVPSNPIEKEKPKLQPARTDVRM